MTQTFVRCSYVKDREFYSTKIILLTLHILTCSIELAYCEKKRDLAISKDQKISFRKHESIDLIALLNFQILKIYIGTSFVR